MFGDRTRRVLVLPVLALAAACGGETEAAADAAPVEAAAPAPTPTSTESSVAPAAGGEVIEIRMTMANGGAFEPAQVTAKPGDVLRFVNVDNVHNVSFPASKNAGASNLPAASPYLTTPGQTYDLKVDLASGEYTFQCDPHAAMGMQGTLTVQ